MKTYTVRVFNFDGKIKEMYSFSTTLPIERNLERIEADVRNTHGADFKNFTVIEEVNIMYEKPCQTSDNLVQKGQSYSNLK